MELMLPRGGTLARGRVTERKREYEGSVIGRSNANPILGTREYKVKFQDGDVTKPYHGSNAIGRYNANTILDTREDEVKFEDGDVTELTANAIDESMYAMCDEKR